MSKDDIIDNLENNPDEPGEKDYLGITETELCKLVKESDNER